jgi:hypothetical protein
VIQGSWNFQLGIDANLCDPSHSTLKIVRNPR